VWHDAARLAGDLAVDDDHANEVECDTYSRHHGATAAAIEVIVTPAFTSSPPPEDWTLPESMALQLADRLRNQLDFTEEWTPEAVERKTIQFRRTWDRRRRRTA
jgi:hypothetical protein